MAENGETESIDVSRTHELLAGILDQALLSIISFGVGFWLVRVCSKEHYGLYLTGMAVVMFVVGAQNALITTQMTVLAPRQQESRKRFCAAMGNRQLLLFGFPIMVVVGGAVVTSLTAGLTPTLLLVSVVALAAFGTLQREFVRSYFFLTRNLRAILVIDLIFTACWLFGIAVCGRVIPAQQHLTTLLLAGAASLLTGIGGKCAARMPLSVCRGESVPALSTAWRGGRWSLAGMSVTWLQDQTYIYLVGAVVGIAATAEAGAARLLLAPVGVVLAGVFRPMLPVWAHLSQEQKHGMLQRRIWQTALLAAGGVAGYALLIAVCRDIALKAILPRSYAGIGLLVILWGILCSFQAARSAFSAGLQASQRFRVITLANSFSAVLVIGLGIVLAERFGAAGGIMAQIVGEATLTVILGRAVAHGI